MCAYIYRKHIYVCVSTNTHGTAMANTLNLANTKDITDNFHSKIYSQRQSFNQEPWQQIGRNTTEMFGFREAVFRQRTHRFFFKLLNILEEPDLHGI